MKNLIYAFLLIFSFSSVQAQQVQTTSKKAPATAKQATKVSGIKTKKDGTPDKRYKVNKKLKKDGTPDKRFKENK